MKIFTNCTVVLQFDSLTSFKDKLSWRKKITENGGVVSYVLTKKASFLVVFNTKNASCSFKIRQSHRHNIPVVGPKYVDQCLTRKRLLDIGSYKLTDENNNERFTKGKISSNQSTIFKQKKKKRVSVKLGSHPSFIYGDVDAPYFNEETFELPKWALLIDKDFKTIQVLEIHVSPGDVKENKVRLFAQSGTVTDKKETSVEDGIVWYFDTVDAGVSGYEQLYRRYSTSPVNMSVCEPGTVEIDNLGSTQFKMVLGKLSLLNEKISPQVAALTDHIWSSALEEVDNLLQVEMQFIREKQVEDGRLALARIADKIVSDSEDQQLYDEFYEAIPYKPEHRKTGWTLKDVVRNQDLCQLLADIISVSEATDWSSTATVIAKYQALGCHLSVVNQSEKEFKNISQKLGSSLGEGGLVHNIYKIRRTIEEVSFQSNVGEIQQLMHASQFSNYLGILSRGLILPNVVTDKMGVARTDAGLLGAGIYFADSASKSAHYSKPNPKTGTRLMLLCDVALGQRYEVTEPNLDLIRAPDGFDSVQGIKVTDENNSFFKDNEYAIYNSNQQCMKYLVEFSLPCDKVKYEPGVDGIDLLLDKHLAEPTEKQDTNVDIKDVKNVPDPLAKIKAGLQGNKNEHVPLKAVHVRAKLMDMISQVVVLQSYRNDNKKAIEAKYVFPLDSYAAVCGFEAFINGKHIIGEVKEKAKARKEYREAVSKGHGAYLMEEETPDVFSVSVGNLPPNSDVLIKITYVAELQVDGDSIYFTLPATVAPWLRDGTLAQKTQSITTSVKVSSNKKCAFSLQCSLEMPSDIRKISSPTHKINCKKTATKAVITLPKKASLNDGFQLNVFLAEIHVPRMWVEKHPITNTQACMLTFYPEFETSTEIDPEIILLLDMSNSMKSGPEELAKKVALLLLDNLPPSCLFNIIPFGSTFKELFPSTQKYSKVSADIAKKQIMECSANMGSTDIWSPLHASQILTQSNSYTSNLFVISDGHVTQESEVVMATKHAVQTNRVFTLGVGSTVNHHLLRNLASTGGGTYEHYSEDIKSAWQRKLCSQIEKACQPGLIDVKVDWLQTNDNAPPPVQAPNQIPCLFSGSRQVVYGLVESCMQATLKAKIGGYDISTMVSTTDLCVTTGEILHRLTAKAIIADYENGVLDDDKIQHQLQKSERKQYIIDLSKQFSIVTQYTSFVAVEERSEDDSIVKEAPSIDDLVAKETVDFLPYMGYDTGEQEEEKDPELCITELLQRGEVAESFSMVQAEETYTELDSYIEIIVKKTDLIKKVYKTLTRFYSQTQAQSIGDIISQIEPAYKSAMKPELPEVDPDEVEMVALMPPEISLDNIDIETTTMDIENLPDLPSDDSNLMDIENLPDLPSNVTMLDKQKRPSVKKKMKLKRKISSREISNTLPMSNDLEESVSLSSVIQPPASLALLDQFDPSTAYFDPKTRSMAGRNMKLCGVVDPKPQRFDKTEQTNEATEGSNVLEELKILNGTVSNHEFRAKDSSFVHKEQEKTTIDDILEAESVTDLLDYDEELLGDDFSPEVLEEFNPDVQSGVTENRIGNSKSQPSCSQNQLPHYEEEIGEICFFSAEPSAAKSSSLGTLIENRIKSIIPKRKPTKHYLEKSPVYSPTSPSYSPTSPAYPPALKSSVPAPGYQPESLADLGGSSAVTPTSLAYNSTSPAKLPTSPASKSTSTAQLLASKANLQTSPANNPTMPQQQALKVSRSISSGFYSLPGDQPKSTQSDKFSRNEILSNKEKVSVKNQQTHPVFPPESPPVFTDEYCSFLETLDPNIRTPRIGQFGDLGFSMPTSSNNDNGISQITQIGGESFLLPPSLPSGFPSRGEEGGRGGFDINRGRGARPKDRGMGPTRGRGWSSGRGGRGRGASRGIRSRGKVFSRGKQIASKAARKSCPAEDTNEDNDVSDESTRDEEEKTEDRSRSKSRDEQRCDGEQRSSSRGRQRHGLRQRSRSRSRRDWSQRSRSVSRERWRKYGKEKERAYSRDRDRDYYRTKEKERGRYKSGYSEKDQSLLECYYPRKISRSRSRSKTRYRYRTKSRSPYMHKSDSRSPYRQRRRSRKPKYRTKSRSPQRLRSASRSPYRQRSRSRSPKYGTKSKPPDTLGSDSRSPKRPKKRSRSPRNETKSRSPYRHKRYSRSPSYRTKSRSPDRKERYSNLPGRYRGPYYRHMTRSRSSSVDRFRKHSRSPRKSESRSPLRHCRRHRSSSSSRSTSDSERSDRRGTRSESGSESRSKSRSERRLRSADRNRSYDRSSDLSRSGSGSEDDQKKASQELRREKVADKTDKVKVTDTDKVTAVKTKLVRNTATGRWERKEASPEKSEDEIDLESDKPSDKLSNTPSESDQGGSYRTEQSDSVWRDVVWDKEIDLEMAYHEIVMMLEKNQQYYDLTEVLCSELGLQYADIVDVLVRQGIKSLGKTKMTTFYRIVASLLVVIFIIKIQYRETFFKKFPNILIPSFKYSILKIEGNKTFQMFFGDEKIVLPYQLCNVIAWLEEQERVMPELYKVLELGKTKMEFIANLCGIFRNM